MLLYNWNVLQFIDNIICKKKKKILVKKYVFKK